MQNTTKMKINENVKPKKVLMDNIDGISKPALQRILRRAGVKRIKCQMYDELRSIMKRYMENIIKNIVVFVEHDRRKTIQMEDLTAALEINGVYLAAGLNPNTKKTKSIQSCNSKGKSGPVKKSKIRDENSSEGNQDGVNKKNHRFRPGTRAIRAIKYQQKNSDFLAVPKANFQRLSREITQKHSNSSIRFSEGVIEFLQLTVECFLIDLCTDAYKCTIFSKRDTIHPEDVRLALAIRKDEI